ncbi:MAG TPA: helix-hairpin-helix domain-containing protein [Pirellulales bacterium]|jgi:competence protein ComEA|nr:helix-hairpin-helix domain-containing protein [Pirellulales bacterium]
MADDALQFNRRDEGPPWRIRDGDQRAIAGLLAVALVAMAVYWWLAGGMNGTLVEIDQQPPLTAKFVVDLNRADWPELAQLPGVGETLARRIVEARDKHGPWTTVDELRQVKGMGPKTLEALRPYVTVEPPGAAEPSAMRPAEPRSRP